MKNSKMKSVQAMLFAFTLLSAFSAHSVFAAIDSSKGDVVNINEATEVELSYLPGIGPTTAARIITARKNRLFKKPQQLMRVKGIGRKTFMKLQNFIVISGPTTAAKKIKASQP